MDMTKEATAYIAQQAITAQGNRITEHDGRTFLTDGDGTIDEYRPNDGADSALEVHTLAAVAEYILKTAERSKARLIVKISDQDRVTVYGELDKYGHRETLLLANARHPNFRYGDWMQTEDFIIALQSRFVQTDETKLLLKLVGNLKEEDARTQTDDGVTQVATARTGVASVSEVIVPNPITLQPYRTFAEVEQPASDFVFRLHHGPSIGLFEGDGGAWVNTAIDGIAEYLRVALERAKDRVTILA